MVTPEEEWVPAPPSALAELTTEQLRELATLTPEALALEMAQQRRESGVQREWMTTAEAARYMRTGDGVIRRWYKEGRFPALDLGKTQGIRIDRADLDAAMEPTYYEPPPEG